MRIGVGFSSWRFGLPTADELMNLPEKIENLGIDSLWLADHILPNSPHLETLTLLSAYAAKTRRMKLGTSVLLLPLRSPLLVAKAIATLDYLSNGRIVLGVGIGGENPGEYRALNVPLKERKSRVEEGIEILRLLWTKSHVDFHGQHYDFEDVTIEPKPVQKPWPSIWIGGKSVPALTRVGRVGDGWFASFVTPEEYTSGMSTIEHVAKDANRDVQTVESGVNLNCYLGFGSAPMEAESRFMKEFEAFGATSSAAAFGSPKKCVETIERYLQEGCTKFVLWPYCEPSELPSQLLGYAKEIIPSFH